MNASKNRYTVKFEPSSHTYTIYNGSVAAYTGYDSKLEADSDLQKLKEEGNPASASDFESFFKTTFGELGKIA